MPKSKALLAPHTAEAMPEVRLLGISGSTQLLGISGHTHVWCGEFCLSRIGLRPVGATLGR